MSFSSIAIEQREKEFKALKGFLTGSTIASLVLHVAVLASGVGNLLARVPEMEEEPIELTFVEPEVKQTPLTPEEKKQEKPEKEKLALGNNGGEIITSSGGNSGGSSVARNPVNVPIPQQPIQVEKPIEKSVTTPIQKFIDNSKPQPVKEDTVVSQKPQPKVESQTPIKTTTTENTPNQDSQTPATPVATNTAPIKTSTNTQENSENLRNILGSIRDNRASEANTGNTGNGSSESNQPAGGGNSPPCLRKWHWYRE